MRRPAAFTVLELLVAIAIAGLVLAIAAPRLHALVPVYEVDRAARLLALDLERTRWLAIARNSRARLVVDLAAESWATEVEGPSGYATVFVRDLRSGVGFDPAASTRVASGRITLVFEPRGNTATAATVALTAGESLRRRVILNSLGRARISG